MQTASEDTWFHQPGGLRPRFTANSSAGSSDRGALARGRPGEQMDARIEDQGRDGLTLFPFISVPFHISLKASWAAVPRTKLNSLP